MNNSGLIICPQCKTRQKKNILGSVMPDGKLAILRHDGNIIVIQSTEMTIICTCGFGTSLGTSPAMVTYTLKS